MQKNTPEQNYYQEDEIDLKELFKILWLKKNFILGITATITILAGIYAFNKTPVSEYEASALIELGKYNHNNKPINSSSYLIEKLNTTYLKTVDLNYFDTGTILSIKKKNERFIEVTSQSSTSENSKVKISNLIAFIQENENQTAHNAFKEWDIMEDKLVTDEALLKDKLVTDEALLKEMNHNFDSVKKSDPTLASIMLLEKRYLIKDINVIKSAIQKLKETSIKPGVSPSRIYKNSKIFGRIDITDKTAHPKKKLIIAVGFIASFILSIFLVFIMNAFRSEDDKATA
jgi:LPS O-antigen subunit length determinant protein (WzzB/FepE family)